MDEKQATKVPSRSTRRSGDRAFRGLFLVFLLTFLNGAGLLLTAVGLNALGDWTLWQFIGLFGIIEAGSGLANLITPNLWAMPVIEQGTGQRTRTVLALDTLLIPHWGGLARTMAGVVMIAAAGWQTEFGPASVLLPLLVLEIAALQVTLSTVLARGGVELHDYDVLQVTLNWYREIEIPPISLSASALQFVLGLITIPAISILSPGSMYQPEIGPSSVTLFWMALAVGLTAVGSLAVWWGRIERRAPREQRLEAEVHA